MGSAGREGRRKGVVINVHYMCAKGKAKVTCPDSGGVIGACGHAQDFHDHLGSELRTSHLLSRPSH